MSHHNASRPGDQSGAPSPVREPQSCRRCGSSDLIETRCRTGPHFARIDCRGCGRMVKFVAAGWTPERAMAFTVPFGRHMGRTVGDLIGTPDGRRYLEWMASAVRGNPGTAASVALTAEEGGVA